MKKVLIISIHSLPFDVIASYRAKAYCDHLRKHDLYPTLLTTQWKKGLDGEFINHTCWDEIIEEEYPTHNVIRLPNLKPKKSKSSLHTFIGLLKGNIDVELIPTYELYKNFLFNHLRKNKFDLIIGIFSPHFHLKLAAEAGLKFKIPYVLDFRDLWGTNRIAQLDYTPSLKEKVQDVIIGYWWRKWMRDSLFYSITSKDWLNILNNISGIEKGYVIRNGIEKFHLNRIEKSEHIFKIVFFGALYPGQDLKLFFSGFSKFVKEGKNKNVVLEIIGLKERYRDGIKDEIFRSLPVAHVKFTPSMPKENLLDYCMQADLFWHPSFTTIKGWFSAKIYDYMALGKEIVVSPGDEGEVDYVIAKTRSGVILNTSEEVAEFLKTKFQELNRSKENTFSPHQELLKGYTRESQVEKMALIINRSLK